MWLDLFRRSGWLALGAATGRLLPLALLLVASRQLDSGTFASASAGFAWAGVAMSLTGAGLATVMTQRLGASTSPAIRLAEFASHARPSLLLALVLAAFVLLFGTRLAPSLFGPTLDPRVVPPAALAGALWSQVALCVAALNGCHRARTASGLMAACGLLQGCGMGLGLLSHAAGAHGVVWGLAGGSAAAAALAALQVRATLDAPSWASLWRAPARAPRVWRLSGIARRPVLWNSLAAASVLPISFIAGGLVSRAGADGARQLAQYFALEQVHQLLMYAPALVGQALLPILAQRLHTHGDFRKQRTMLLRIGQLSILTAGLGTLVAAVIMLDPTWFVRLLGNPALHVKDAWAVRWMTLNAGLGLSLALLGGALLGANHIVLASSLNLVWGGVFVGLTAVLASHGNEGLQFARFAASMILVAGATVALMLLVRRGDPPHVSKEST